MTEVIHNRVASLLVRLLIWSLVSVPCFWLPQLADRLYYYPSGDRLLFLPCCAGAPFLLYGIGISVQSLVRLFKVLKSHPLWQRCLVGLVGLLLSAPIILVVPTFCVLVAISAGDP